MMVLTPSLGLSSQEPSNTQSLPHSSQPANRLAAARHTQNVATANLLRCCCSTRTTTHTRRPNNTIVSQIYQQQPRSRPYWPSDLLVALAATLVSALAPVPLLEGVPSCSSAAAAAAAAAFFASASRMAWRRPSTARAEEQQDQQHTVSVSATHMNGQRGACCCRSNTGASLRRRI